jgi:hypothetical protein
MSHGGAILSDIYEKLSTSKIQVYDDCVRHRDIISRANTLADSLLTAPPSVESFRDFLKTTYNFYVDTDILVKTCLLRTIRLCISSPASRVSLQLSACLIETEWHYLIITSIEREPLIESVEEWRGGGEMVTQDYLIERMQVSTLLLLLLFHFDEYSNGKHTNRSAPLCSLYSYIPHLPSPSLSFTISLYIVKMMTGYQIDHYHHPRFSSCGSFINSPFSGECGQ